MAWHLCVDWCASNKHVQYHAAHPIRGEITGTHAVFAPFKHNFVRKSLYIRE